jgi:hypothetical protein
MQLLHVEIKIIFWKKLETPGENIVQINCDTADVVRTTVQIDLSSDTAKEVKLSDGEGKQVTHSHQEKMG